MLRKMAALSLGLVQLAGCGFDGLFLTPRGFDETPAPRAFLAGTARAGAFVEVMSASGAVIGAAEADGAGAFVVELAEGADARNLRVLARTGRVTTKVIVANAEAGATTDLGVLDARSTAIAQLATYEITQEAGSSFPATPPPALAGLMSKMRSGPTAELDAFAAVIEEILASAAGEGVGVFELASFELSDAFASFRDRYRAAMALAATGYGLEIRCDPSRLASMFTVDTSGRGLDGNGTPQLIRQAVKEGRVYLGFTSDESSQVSDEAIPRKLTPNDAAYAMTDDGQNGDEVAGDGVYTVVAALPRGARLLYKYTNGAAGEGFTGTEEWPGNARIIEIEDVLTGRPDGEPDCLIVRRDSFGDEASNKNFVNLNARARAKGGTLSFDADLGGVDAPLGRGEVRVGGVSLQDLRIAPPLSPQGVAEARENGVCTICPPPLVLDPDDAIAPVLMRADRLSVDRVRVRFSEPLLSADARDLSHWLYLDDAGRSVNVLAATPSGADVILTIAPAHPRNPARVRVRGVRDASVRGNSLADADVEVGPDVTAPKVLSARAMSILEIDPSARIDDPTVGDLVELVLDERPEESAASDAARFQIDGLQVISAGVVEDGASFKLRLVTDTQLKSVPYSISISGLRDPAGNTVDQEIDFEGFALYETTFVVAAGFAYADSAGTARGIPRGEKLYLTGTPLSAARGLDGRDISVVSFGSTRTDVTGWPQFEMTATGELYQGTAVHTIRMLLPRGSWSWKAAHGVEGEYVRPPPTLEKVYKTLATANDATGVRVDPATMTAENGVSYTGAVLSESGDEPPRTNVVFKREAPDEVCEVQADVRCPLVVVGTWRDLVLDQGGAARDYDDGIITLPPHHPTVPDVYAPKLLDARARDSFSVLLSFDETIASPKSTLMVSLARADDGVELPIEVLETNEVKPQQAVLKLSATACEAAMLPGVAYTVRYRGATDARGFVDRRERTQTLLAPETCAPFSPIADREPPGVASVTATDLVELLVRFDERIDPATAVDPASYLIESTGGAELAVERAEVQPDRASVLLTTATQEILQSYTLTVSNVSDAADPANVLTSTSVGFVGFGERAPPVVLRARAIDRDRVLVRFDEPLEPTSALTAANYSIAGLTITGVAFSGDPGRRALAFNPALAPRVRDAVVLSTSVMTAGTSYTVAVSGVRDLSGNTGTANVSFAGVSEPPRIDVVLEYEISDTRRIAGSVPSRAISLAELSESREGVFVLGARATADHTPAAGNNAPVNDVLGGFGVEGQPLDMIEPRLADNGAAPDLIAGDGIYSLQISGVPLGTTIIWKAFAPYSTAYRDSNPNDAFAAFADPLPGPSVFSDGQEYPGNENGIVVLDDGSGDGVVRVRALFGDEITYKKHTGAASYVWVFDDR
jgi:hypothetical protein